MKEDELKIEMGHKIKRMGVLLSRSDAQAFNNFITAAIGE